MAAAGDGAAVGDLVGQGAGDAFADDAADCDGDAEEEAGGDGVEVVGFGEERGGGDDEEDAGVGEYGHVVGGWDEDVGVFEELDGAEEVDGFEFAGWVGESCHHEVLC